MQSWSKAPTAGADLLLYGCSVAQDKVGKAFVNLLSQLTGTDVAASDDLTESAALGGDRKLEYNTEQIETELAFTESAMQGYKGVLDDAVFASVQQFIASNGGFVSPQEVVTDSAGNVYTTGIFNGTVDFDPGSSTVSLTSTGQNNLFISKLDSNGNYVWTLSLTLSVLKQESFSTVAGS